VSFGRERRRRRLFERKRWIASPRLEQKTEGEEHPQTTPNGTKTIGGGAVEVEISFETMRRDDSIGWIKQPLNHLNQAVRELKKKGKGAF